MEGEQKHRNLLQKGSQMPQVVLEIQLVRKALLALYRQTAQTAELMEKLGMDSTNERNEQIKITEMYSIWK